MSELIAKLFARGHTITLEGGTTLFHVGDRVRHMYLVASGQVDLVRHSKSGMRTVLYRAGPGQVLAEASAYTPAYHCEGEAVLPATLRAVPVTEFRAGLDRDIELSNAWVASLAHALQESRMNAEIRTLRTVAERLDAWLAGGRAMPPKGQWQDLAHTLGVTREALYRELARRLR